MVNFADRLDISCRLTGISQVEIAKRLGVTKGSVTQFKAGRPTLHNGFTRIAEILNVPKDWLEHGTGPAPAWFQTPTEILPLPPDQTRVMTEILETLRQMREEAAQNRAIIQKLLEENQQLKAAKPPTTHTPRFADTTALHRRAAEGNQKNEDQPVTNTKKS